MNFTIHNGDNRDILKTLEDNSIDAIVTDPPYGIDFLGKAWDANTGALETYTECLRVLKPGGYILAFSAARTYHHLAVTLEQAGFEIRDQLMWLYSSGFPKAQDIGKAIERREGKRSVGNKAKDLFAQDQTKCQKCNKTNVQLGIGFDCQDAKCPFIDYLKPANNEWAGWKTALKPAHEPICMARKPFKGSTIDNVLEHGVGALNIDATRIPYEDIKDMEGAGLNWNKTGYETGGPRFVGSGDENTVVDKPKEKRNNINEQGRFPSNVLGEVEGYQKFFYCPKVSRRERHIGFEQKSIPTNADGMYTKNQDGSWTGESYQATAMKQKTHDPLGHIPTGNNHPTVKPVALMRYLIKLVTPENSVVLDPFCGSGSTGMAAVELGHTFIGCELDPNYVRIAETRIEAWNRKDESEQNFESLFECL